MSIRSVAHVCVKTNDLKRTEQFYCGALAMKKLFRFTRRSEVIGFYIQAANDTFIEVFRDEQAGHTNDGHPALHHFCLETDSIEALRQRLMEQGCAPTEMIMGADQSLQFWVQDPSGLQIEFQQYTKQSSQFTGGDVEVP